MVFKTRDLRVAPARLCKAICLTTETPFPIGRAALLDWSAARPAVPLWLAKGSPRRHKRQEKLDTKILAGSTSSNPAMTALSTNASGDWA
jgi:hypothetical protein